MKFWQYNLILFVIYSGLSPDSVFQVQGHCLEVEVGEPVTQDIGK